jgi:CRP-like cAMP-binding protein
MEWVLFEGLAQEDVRRLLAAATRRTFKRNEVLFHDGDPADTLHLIAKGRVAARITTSLGETATLDVLVAGGFVGELALLTPQARRAATVIALEPTETMAIHRDDFERIRADHPSVGDVMMRILTERVKRLNGQLLEAMYLPADRRVIRRLLALADIYTSNGNELEVPLTQEDLAGLAGTTRGTVNRVLRDEEKKGLVRLGRGRVTIVDLERLRGRAR